MVYILILLISLIFLIYNFLNINNNEEIVQRLKKLKRQTTVNSEQDELSIPLRDRIIKPVFDSLGKFLLRLAPTEMISSFERKIVMAEKPNNWSVKHWLGIQAFLMAGLPFLILLLYLQFDINIKSLILVVSVTVTIGFLFPNSYLNAKIRKRQTEIMKTLPDIMDLLTVSVEAGLTFDSAISKVVEKMPGALSREFENVVQEVKVGKSKKEALFQMADRVGVQDLRSFISAVMQADQLGVSIGRVLRIQSEQIRQNRKQIIAQKAMKAPIKMLIPMVIFIFPSIFIVLLGPVVINIIRVFSGQ